MSDKSTDTVNRSDVDRFDVTVNRERIDGQLWVYLRFGESWIRMIPADAAHLGAELVRQSKTIS